MSNLVKCKGVDCCRKHDCYRYTSTVNPYNQAYFSDTPIVNGKCSQFRKHQIGRAVNTLSEDLDDEA